VFDIRELRHEPMPGVTVSVRMEGIPLRWRGHSQLGPTPPLRPTCGRSRVGFPYQIGPGESLDQRVTIGLRATRPQAGASAFRYGNLGGPRSDAENRAVSPWRRTSIRDHLTPGWLCIAPHLLARITLAVISLKAASLPKHTSRRSGHFRSTSSFRGKTTG